MFIFQKQVAKFIPLNAAFSKESEELLKSFINLSQIYTYPKSTLKLILSNINVSFSGSSRNKHLKMNKLVSN